MQKRKKPTHKEISREEVGLPSASMDSIKTIEMEGAMFRGMVSDNPKRSIWLRIFSIFVGIFLLSIGSVYVFAGVAELFQGDLFSSLLHILIGALFVVCGFVVIYKNIRIHKK